MKKLILLSLVLVSSSVFAAEKYCPCPGPCCPKVSYQSIDNLTDVAKYLDPWTSKESDNKVMEDDLAKYRV